MALRSGNDISWTPIQGDYGSFASSFASTANTALTNATNAIGKLQEAAQKRRDQDITALNNAATYQLGLEKQNLAERTLQSELDAIKEANDKWQQGHNASIAANQAIFEPLMTIYENSGPEGVKIANALRAQYKALADNPEAQANFIGSFAPHGAQLLSDKLNFGRTISKMNLSSYLQRLTGGDTFGYNVLGAIINQGLQDGTIRFDGKNLFFNQNPSTSSNASALGNETGIIAKKFTSGTKDDDVINKNNNQ